ncbi:hypothetical protein [Polaribacter atrinae]|uniref:hypothetical protein n=1 Tax=Polaribacter atrinae TaxID=1333662 RepID=UPI0030FBE180
MAKRKLSDESIKNLSEFEKEIALDWYTNLSINERIVLLDKYIIATPLTNGCVLKIFVAESSEKECINETT